MVGERGFEPPTPWSRTRCSTRLSHSPTVTRATTRKAIHPRDLLLDGLDHYNIATADVSLRSPDPSFALHLMTQTCSRTLFTHYDLTGKVLTPVDANAR